MKTNQFSIKAKTCTLKYNSQEESSTIINNNVSYVIPIYQRPYSWTKIEIDKFILDIFSSYWGNENDKNIIEEPMFIGTMQLSAKSKNNEQEIIDGQQRLTTLFLLLKALKLKYPDCDEFAELKFDLLKTEVNSGEQQKYLEQAFTLDETEVDDLQNIYLKNLKIINNLINSIIEENESYFDINRFAKYFLSTIYFVVIETHAGLSKTLQIFNAINTTGLDLNGGDLFKIRMYEYLTHNEKEDKSVFEDISKLYQKIDQKNAKLNWDNGINDILSIYQYIIIAKYKLPTTLYYLAVDTFFERLFDTILNINQWEHFKNNVKDVKLSLSEMDKIIEIRYNWEGKLKSKEGFTAEDICALNLIWRSRYSRYWNLVFVFLFAYENVEDNWNKMLMFTKQLNRFFFIYSVRFQRIKSEVYYGEVQNIIHSIVNSSFENTMELLNNSIGDRSKHNTDWYDLDWFLTENLTENAKRKRLICRLSAMLEEDYHTNNYEEINNIENKLFDTAIDIEHIQSFL